MSRNVLCHGVKCVTVQVEGHRGWPRGHQDVQQGRRAAVPLGLSHGQKRSRSAWPTSDDLVSNQASWSRADLQVRTEFARLTGTAGQNGARQAIFPRWQRHSSPRGERWLERGCWTGQPGLGGSAAPQGRLAGAFGTGARTRRLPGVQEFLSCLWSWSQPFEDKQGEAAPPAQIRAGAVACFFSTELINTRNKSFISLGTVSWF